MDGASLPVLTYPGQNSDKEYCFEGDKVVSRTRGDANLGWFRVKQVASLGDLRDTL